MQAYIEKIGCLMVLAAFIQMLAGERYRRDIGFIVGLIILSAVCSPLGTGKKPDIDTNIAFEMPDTRQYEDMHSRILKDGLISNLEDEIKKQTGADRVEVTLGADYAVEEIVLYGADASAAETAAQLCGISRDKIKNGG